MILDKDRFIFRVDASEVSLNTPGIRLEAFIRRDPESQKFFLEVGEVREEDEEMIRLAQEKHLKLTEQEVRNLLKTDNLRKQFLLTFF